MYLCPAYESCCRFVGLQALDVTQSAHVDYRACMRGVIVLPFLSLRILCTPASSLLVVYRQQREVSGWFSVQEAIEDGQASDRRAMQDCAQTF